MLLMIFKGHRLDYQEVDPEYQEVLKSKSAKKYFMSTDEMNEDKINKE